MPAIYPIKKPRNASGCKEMTALDSSYLLRASCLAVKGINLKGNFIYRYF